MIRAVLDHNIFISALIKPNSKARQIVDAWLNHSYTLITSQFQIDDLLIVSARNKLRLLFESSDREMLIEAMELQAEMMAPTGTILLCRDPKDDVLLELAASGQAQFLVSGDKDLIDDDNLKNVMREQHDVQVISLNEFLAVLQAQ